MDDSVVNEPIPAEQGFYWLERNLCRTANKVVTFLTVNLVLLFYDGISGKDIVSRRVTAYKKPNQMVKFTDLVSVDNFRAGGMENWGMMTFVESSLIYAKGEVTDEEKERVAMTICHEVAHQVGEWKIGIFLRLFSLQWFGNLVTMDWWDDLWLNEGFAKYMEFRCIDNLYPDWNIMTQFYTKNVVRSQEEDGQPNPRSVSSHSLDIRSLFDVMSYQKGSAIIRMIESLVGERKFVRALIEYLNKYAYANTHGSQLWDIVEKVEKT
uniref:Peptidase_M1 domain-containing protein n=1 Tax=Angiostrongylus cantonensis TaxID=6313 RepID=A0A0K0CVG1_ANGCA